MTLSNEEWQTLQDAWSILESHKDKWMEFAQTRAIAAGQLWANPSWVYPASITPRGIIFHDISGYEDGYDTDPTEFTVEELLNMDELLTKHTIMAKVIRETSEKEAKERTEKVMREQYERLKKQFEPGGGDA